MPNKRQVTPVSVTTTTILKVIAILALIYVLYLISDILILLLTSAVLASALMLPVDYLHQKKIPRTLSLVIIYGMIIAILSLSVYLIIPPIIKETGELANSLPAQLEKAQGMLFSFGSRYPWLNGLTNSLETVNQNLPRAAGGVFDAVTGLFGGVVSFFLVMVITFYMVAEENSLFGILHGMVPKKYHKKVQIFSDKVQEKIGQWFIGQIVLCFSIFLCTYIGLLILGVKYALVLAIIAGILEAVPYLGPILSSVPGMFLAYVQSPILAVAVAVMYFVIQQLENNFLVPIIMKKAVGLNPIVSITVLMIGFELSGILGALLAIPIATAISVIIKYSYDNKAKKL